MEDLVVDEHRRTGFCGNHDLLWMRLKALVGIAVCVHGEVRSGNYAEWGNFQGQVVQIIQHPDHDRYAAQITKDVRTVGLTVRMEANPGVPWL